MRVYAILLNDSGNETSEKFEILGTNFLPEPDTIIIVKRGSDMMKATVVKVENLLERVGDSADLTFNVFIKPVPPEEDVN